MLTLNWIDKDKVVNHAAVVPFLVLEHKYHFDDTSGNKIYQPNNKSCYHDRRRDYDQQ